MLDRDRQKILGRPMLLIGLRVADDDGCIHRQDICPYTTYTARDFFIERETLLILGKNMSEGTFIFG